MRIFDKHKTYRFFVKTGNQPLFIYHGKVLEEDENFILVEDKIIKSLVIRKNTIEKAEEVIEEDIKYDNK